MKDYKESQFGWLVVIIIFFMEMFFTYLYINELGDRPLTTNVFIFVSGLNAIILLLFYSMTVTVDNEKIKISFGVGVISKTINIATIKSIEVVKNSWYYGWGIRLIPNGWLYNIGGSQGIELQFIDKKSVIRIGSKDSATLKKEIVKRLTN